MGTKKYYSDRINLMNKNWDHWVLIRFSAFFKKKTRLARAEIELIESYKLALDKMYKAIKDDRLLCNPRIEEEHSTIQPYATVFKTYSLGIPFLFLARHLIELSLKNYLENSGNTVVIGHKISNLWEECKKKSPEFSVFDDLVECIYIMDDDELHFRYAKDKKGNEYDNKPLFINYEKIYKQTKVLSINLAPTTTIEKYNQDKPTQ